MNILTKYTKAALIKNKTRTIVTIIGIILSVSMFTAVAEAIVSAQKFFIDYICHAIGSYHAYVPALDSSEASALTKEYSIKEYESLETIGYADIGSENVYKPYLFVASMSDGFEDMVAINLKSGRLPENPSEIILPYHLFENGNVSFLLGDTLDLQVGKRTLGGKELYQLDSFEEGERLIETTAKKYTVVGFYERFDFSIENYTAPGYTAITTGEKGIKTDVFFKFRSVYNAKARINDIFEKYHDVMSNSSLLKMHGILGSEAMRDMIWGFAFILVALIMFGSVSLIYNSFSISVSERTKQFGMLKSVGATKRQIRRTVIKEALMLCLVAVPLGLVSGCAGIGITLSLISEKFSMLLTKVFAEPVLPATQISLYISPIALMAAAFIGVVTTLISAYIPARRAVRITPLEAVRQSADIKIKRRRIKKYRLTRKLFGFEAMIAAKNFARNKKRYRAAVISMFMSIVLFITASSFCDYLTKSIKTVSRDVGYDIRVYLNNPPEKLDFLLDIKNAKESAYCSTENYDVYLQEELLDGKYSSSFTGKFVHNVRVVFVNDDSYLQLIKDNKLRNNGGAVIVNSYKSYREDGRVTAFSIVDEKKVKDSIKISLPKEIDGYYYSNFDGESFHYYEQKEDGGSQNQIKLSFDEALKEYTFDVAGFIDDKPYFVETNGIAAIYPMSKMTEGSFVDSAFYIADDYTACEQELEQAFTDRSMGYSIFNNAEENATNRALGLVINIFSYGFIVLISLIAIANVFNTITTNIYLRRSELAMTKSVGITKRGFNKMMNYECIICGVRSLIFGLPASVVSTYLIYRAANNGFDADFYLPWYSVTIAVLSVFVVIFTAMLYSMKKLSKENIVETLRNENI